MEMDQAPMGPVLAWAARAVGADAKVVAVQSLHEARMGPWRLRIAHGGGTSDVVLRVPSAGWIGEALIATGAAALRVTERHSLAPPPLLASDLDGRATGGVPATLETALPGSSASPAEMSVERLRAAGAALARVHAIPLTPQPDLPLRTRPCQVDDHAMEARWATLNRACADSERGAVIAALCELTGWSVERARHVLTGPRSTPLLQLAFDRVRGLDRPRGETVFVHGDLWAGNMLWDGDTCVALIDWKTAGAGHPGVDLGNLRMKMATEYGPAAPAHVLDGWERERGRAATDVPYWDAVAALHTPAELDDWEEEAAARGGAAAPAGRGQPALEVQAGRDEQPLDVDVEQAAQPEPAQAVPLLGLAEERLDPDPALAHRPLVGRRPGGDARPLHRLGVDGALDLATAAARSTLRLERAAVAGGRRRLIDDGGVPGFRLPPAQGLALRAAVFIPPGVRM